MNIQTPRKSSSMNNQTPHKSSYIFGAGKDKITYQINGLYTKVLSGEDAYDNMVIGKLVIKYVLVNNKRIPEQLIVVLDINLDLSYFPNGGIMKN